MSPIFFGMGSLSLASGFGVHRHHATKSVIFSYTYIRIGTYLGTYPPSELKLKYLWFRLRKGRVILNALTSDSEPMPTGSFPVRVFCVCQTCLGPQGLKEKPS